MDLRNLFKHGKKVSAKMIRSNYRKNPLMKDVMSNPEAAKILNESKEQKEFHSRIAEKAKDGSLTGAELQETFYELRQGKGNAISSKEGRGLAGVFFSKWQKRYKRPAETKLVGTKSTNVRSSKENIVSENYSAKKSVRTLPDYFRYRAKPLPPSAKGEKIENKHASFFDAMRSVARNKKQQ